MTQEEARDFVKYSFYKVAPEWRLLPGDEKQRERTKEEFAATLAEFSDRIAMSSYSLVGTRGDVDFMLWKVSRSLEAIDELMAQLNRTELAGYLQHAPLLPGHDPPLPLRRRPPARGAGGDHRHHAHRGPQIPVRLSLRQDPRLVPAVPGGDGSG